MIAEARSPGLGELDYPHARLDVKLLIEEDDPETLDGDPRPRPRATSPSS